MINNSLNLFHKNGKIIIFGEDEEEADLILLPKFFNQKILREVRNIAGGLISIMISHEIALTLDIELVSKIYQNCSSETIRGLSNILKKRNINEANPRVSIGIDYHKTKTGISDYDRSLTISEFYILIKDFHNAILSEEEVKHKFIDTFLSPGHVNLLIASQKLLIDRKGHSELAISICKLLKIEPVVITCEMINSMSYESCNYNESKKTADINNIPFITSSEIINLMQSKC